MKLNALLPLAWPIGVGFTAAILFAANVVAIDIDGVLNASLDQPQIHVVIRRTHGGDPLSIVDPLFGEIFSVQAFYDSGASGIVLSNDTANQLGIARQQFSGELIVFEDVAVGGKTTYNVSEPLYFSLAPFHPNTDLENIGNVDRHFTQHFGPIRSQIGPLPEDPLLLGPLDIFGMPVIEGKVVVIDPTPLNTFVYSGDIFDVDSSRTYVYDPSTPYNPVQRDIDPGIPITTHTVQLSRGDFQRFTQITPSDAPVPKFNTNPFIGPDPLEDIPSTSVNRAAPIPGVKIGHNGLTSEGSWLFDMGAVATIISTEQAAKIGVAYSTNPDHELGSADPQLVGVALEKQYTLSIGGAGGVLKAAGFLLDSMLLRTMEGIPSNDNDPNHIRYLNAPVLVADISLLDPNSPDPLDPITYTLDGIFGMNLVMPTLFFDEEDPFGSFETLSPTAYDWLVFDTINNVLGFKINPAFLSELTTPGDFDGDGDVDGDDFLIWQNSFATLSGANLSDGDGDGDGDVDGDDFLTWQNAFPFPAILATAIPEPATLSLLIAAVFVLAGGRWKSIRL